MTAQSDGPASNAFFPLAISGIRHAASDPLDQLAPEMAHASRSAPQGHLVCWGIPFAREGFICLAGRPVEMPVAPFQASWLVFLHTANLVPPEPGPHGFISPMRGEGRLNEHLADYVICFSDGTEERAPIRRRLQIGTHARRWDEVCFEAVTWRKPHPRRAPHEQLGPDWGPSQTRVSWEDVRAWTEWLWAWQNPHAEKWITGLRFEPISGVALLGGVAAGTVQEHPLRWRTRRKAILRLPEGVHFQPELDLAGRLAQVQLDLGQVISARPRPIYPREAWESSYNNQLPQRDGSEILVEYSAHPEACFHLPGRNPIPVSQVEAAQVDDLQPIPPAAQRVVLRVVERGSQKPVAVKLHVHGAAGEYLAPVDRHRSVNTAWFEDYSTDFAHLGQHECTYIPGETLIDLPLGRVYLEISKGFEIRPLRKMVEITPETDELVVELERVLDWRQRGWVTADTHVHFLSPMTALLEGAAEGVNVINLLASQWGELMTNVGDFDGQTTWGERGAGGEGEYLVRVGTENRQRVLGHISLLGYRGRIIAPMTCGGPDEAAIGDPVDTLLTEWARQCHAQGGLVVLPHFPDPRGEHAASIVAGQVDALEMACWERLYGGISPYSLSDWYRYLNCGYQVPVVGGTDKMNAETAVGTVRTYAHLAPDQPFTYEAWLEAIRRGETFVTYGPLVEFLVEGRPMGSQISLPAGGGALAVTWQVASVTVPMSRVELVVNGEIRESQAVGAWQGAGSWDLRLDRSAWAALLVRGHYSDQPEIVAAHSSPVKIDVAGSPLLAAADAVTILEQIEGALAYLDTVGTRAEDRAYKRMRLELESAHRRLHNRLHAAGQYHHHSPLTDHPEHHGEQG
jgi:hypothetical protein